MDDLFAPEWRNDPDQFEFESLDGASIIIDELPGSDNLVLTIEDEGDYNFEPSQKYVITKDQAESLKSYIGLQQLLRKSTILDFLKKSGMLDSQYNDVSEIEN